MPIYRLQSTGLCLTSPEQFSLQRSAIQWLKQGGWILGPAPLLTPPVTSDKALCPFSPFSPICKTVETILFLGGVGRLGSYL